MSTPKQAQAVKTTAAKFVFIGDPKDNFSGPPVITVKGVRFMRGRPSEVPNELVPFFEQHNHFATPQAAEKIAQRLMEADAQKAKMLDDATLYDDNGGKTPPVRKKPVDEGQGSEDLESLSMAQLHMRAAERELNVTSDITKEDLIAALRAA